MRLLRLKIFNDFTRLVQNLRGALFQFTDDRLSFRIDRMHKNLRLNLAIWLRTVMNIANGIN